MTRFLLRRLAWSALVVWVVATTVFVIYFAVPRDVARLIAGRQASEQTIQIVRTRLGLDQPMGVQYLSFLRRLAGGDLGESFLTQEPVTAIVARDFPVTASCVRNDSPRSPPANRRRNERYWTGTGRSRPRRVRTIWIVCSLA